MFISDEQRREATRRKNADVWTIRLTPGTNRLLFPLVAYEALQYTNDNYGRITPSVPKLLELLTSLYDVTELETLTQHIQNHTISKRLLVVRILPETYEKFEEVSKESGMTISQLLDNS